MSIRETRRMVVCDCCGEELPRAEGGIPPDWCAVVLPDVDAEPGVPPKPIDACPRCYGALSAVLRKTLRHLRRSRTVGVLS